MKIAIVTDAWHPQVNGVVTTLGQTIRVLESWGHQVLAVTPELFATLPCPTYPEISLSLFPRREMKKLLGEFRPEAIHIATEGPLGWAARNFCLKGNIGFTTSYHTRFPEYVRLRVPVPLSLSYKVVRHFHNAAKRTMVATEPLASELRERGFRNLSLWSRGVDTDLFRPRAKSFFTDQRPIFLYVGRVAVEKNIEAFLRLDLPGTKVVVGEGPALVDMGRKYPQARFPGYKRGLELAHHMAAADVFVFPSRTDTFGLVMLEAMACGVPVAAYPVTGPASLVLNGENGFLDEDLGRAALAALQARPEACRRFAKHYSWEACTEQFLNNLYPISI